MVQVSLTAPVSWPKSVVTGRTKVAHISRVEYAYSCWASDLAHPNAGHGHEPSLGDIAAL